MFTFLNVLLCLLWFKKNPPQAVQNNCPNSYFKKNILCLLEKSYLCTAFIKKS